ncbi:hypothetical protein ACFP3I_17340 [Chryseobacterium arachidis]
MLSDHNNTNNHGDQKPLKTGRNPKSHKSRNPKILIMETQELVVGGWTKYHTLTPEDQKVFNEAMQGLVGVNYKPQEVSTQLVNGTNYRFKCLASLPGGSQVVWEAIVEIYAPINGNPHIVSIHRI